MDVGKEFDQWVETGRDESMEKGHFEASQILMKCPSKYVKEEEL